MILHTARCPRVFPVRFVALLLLVASVTACFALTKEEVAERKEELSLRLDSLEMEKQHKKREGESLEELEQATAAVRDSIEQLRLKVAKLSDEGVLPPPERSSDGGFDLTFLTKGLKGRSVFDYVVVAVGLVALLAGVVLVVGIVRAFSGPGRRRKTPKSGQKRRIVPSARSGPPTSGPSVPGGDADINKEGIESLRERVSSDIRRIQRFDSEQPAGLRNQGGADDGAAPAEGETLRDRILEAAREGLDVQQISKRFHISVDQVALILRVARNGR